MIVWRRRPKGPLENVEACGGVIQPEAHSGRAEPKFAVFGSKSPCPGHHRLVNRGFT
jgi:hypothetical protein